MSLKDFKRIDFEDTNLRKLQDNIKLFVDQLDFNFLSGNLISETTIDTTTTLVAHELGRRFNGYLITDIQGDARVWRDTTSTADNTKFIPLKASASVVVKLWVF